MIGSGVDVCIRDFNRRSIRIRETRRVKVGHIATGISDQVRSEHPTHALTPASDGFTGGKKEARSRLMCAPFFFFFLRSPRGFSPWKPRGASEWLTTRRCRSPVWSSAVFRLQTSAPPGGGGSETGCWRPDKRPAAPSVLHAALCRRVPNSRLDLVSRGLCFQTGQK